MPDPFERHAKSKWDYGSEPARNQQRAEAANDDPGRKRKPKKKSPDACKQNHWGPHEYVLFKERTVKDPNPPCRWSPIIRYKSPVECEPEWFCHHVLKCKHCGRIGGPTTGNSNWRNGRIPAQQCPEFNPDVPDSVHEECEKTLEHHFEFRARRAQRKPPITGPKGYRKKR
jgi:hypothetical protein